MADYTKAASVLLAHQEHDVSTDSPVTKGTEVDVTTFLRGTIYVYHANITITGNAIGVDYILQGRYSLASGVNEDWIDLIPFRTGNNSAAGIGIAGVTAQGATSILMDGPTASAFPIGTSIYIRDVGTVADGEWSRVTVPSSGPDAIDVIDGIANAKDGSDDVFNEADLFSAEIDLAGIAYVRMIRIANDGAVGSDSHFKADILNATEIS